MEKQDTEQVFVVDARTKPIEDKEPEKLQEAYVPYGVTTFADLDAALEAQELASANYALADQYQQLIWNVFSSETVEDKAGAIAALTTEFQARIKAPSAAENVGADDGQEIGDDVGALPIENDQAPTSPNLLIESAAQVQLVEDEGTDALVLEAVVIEPGAGNARDGHYYTAQLLQEYSGVFKGVKMYATDHKANEKSERTEVSEILECPVRFTETGAPVARIGVYDPLFAKKVRNRASLGTLANLQCSILASGTAKAGTIDGAAVKVVESIDVAHSVDWVTKAGAGGRAINLVEGDRDMELEKELEQEQEQELKQEPEQEPEPIAEAVTIKEQDAEPKSEPAPEPEPEPEPVLSLQEIATRLGQTTLPVASLPELIVAHYANLEELDAAITSVMSELRQAGSGRPYALQESAAPAPVTIEEVNARKDGINAKWGIGRAVPASE